MRIPALPLAALTLAAGTSLAQPSDSDLAARVDAIAARTLAQPNAVGLSIAVARGDKVVLAKGFGKADLETGFPADKDTLFRIGSVTKQFSAAAVMKLAEQGKLSLDDTLGTLLPDFPKTAKPITLRQILNHTSGIWSYTENDSFMEREASLELTPAQLIDTFKDHPLDFDPGTKWSYSNSAYYLVGEIVAKASGKPYPAYLQDEFFTPLGLSRTRYESNREIIANRAQGYSLDKGVLVNDRPIGADVPGAAGSLLSSAEGLVRWSIALSAGKAVSAKSYEQMTSPAVLPDGKNTEYGFGLSIDTWEGRPRISHGGGIFGFTSMLATFPKDGLTVAVISNCDSFNPGKLAESIARAALDLKEFTPADLPVTSDEAARYAGTYAFTDIPLELRVFERDGKLYAQATGQRESRLLSQGHGEFRPDFDADVKFVFPEGTGPAETFTLHQRGEHPAKRKK